MVGEVLGALQALKGASDIIKSLMEAGRAMAISPQLIDLRFQIVEALDKVHEAREAETAYLSRIDELEREIEEARDWEREKSRYQLVEVYRGSLAYTLKPAEAGAEPAHYICPACYQEGKKSILQTRVLAFAGKQLSCPRCSLQIDGGYDGGAPIVL